MAIRYVWSAATGSGTGADWTNAYTTLVAANTAGAAGDEYRIASDHQEDLTATLTMKGTAAVPDRLISVNRTSGLPEQMKDSTGYIGTAGTTALNIAGTIYGYGIHFRPGGGSGTTNNVSASIPNATGNFAYLRKCTASIPNSNGCRFGPAQSSHLILDDFSITNGHPYVRVGPSSNGFLEWRNTTTPFSMAPNSNGFISANELGEVWLDGLDLSIAAAGSALYGGGVVRRMIVLTGCKLNSSLSLPTPTARTDRIDIINCTDESGNARDERIWMEGKQTREATIKRTGGATDGANTFSWKVVTTTSATRDIPFDTFDLDFYVPSAKVGVSTTATVHVLTDGVTLTDADCRLVVQAAVTSGQALLTGYSDGPADPLATPANQATSSATWTTTGLTSPVKQQLDVTFTPTRTGAHRLKVRVGRASTTVYICPKVEIA